MDRRQIQHLLMISAIQSRLLTIKILGATTLSLMTLAIMTFSYTIFSITTFSITTISMKGLKVTLSIYDTRHKRHNITYA